MATYAKNVNTFTDYGAEAQDIERRRKMAEMLQQQSMQPIEQQTGVPISWTQGLAKLLQGYNAGQGQQDATKRQQALSERARTDAMNWAQGMPQPTSAPMVGSAEDTMQFDIPAQMETKQPSKQDMMAWALKGGLSGNPIATQLAGPFMAQAMKQDEDYTLGEGQKRFRGGQVVAEGGPRTFAPQAERTPLQNNAFPVSDGKVQPHISFDNGKTWTPVPGSVPTAKFADPTKVNVTTSVNTEKKYGEAFAGKIADADVSLRDAAEKAPQLAERANRIKEVLSKGNTITGFGADFRLGFGKAAALAGLEAAGDAAANTETLAAGLAQNTMDAIKASGMGGGTGFSNADRDFLEKAVGGKITLESQAISRLADLAHRAASLTAQRWTKRVSQIPKSAIEGTGIDTGAVQVQPLFGEQQQQNNPQAQQTLPPQARSKLSEGVPTTFGNGQQWTLRNGVPVRLK